MRVQFKTCGTCARFDKCWAESSQIMQTKGVSLTDDYEECKKIPACDKYQKGG